MQTFVIIGAGPVGSTAAVELATKGHTVKMVTRSGSGPQHSMIERVSVDAKDSVALSRIAKQADVLMNCANPPYARWDLDWPPLATSILRAAAQSGAALVTMSNLYGYGPRHQTMNATTPLESSGKKGMVRSAMWREAKSAHDSGRVRVAEVRASDFFGPLVTDAGMGERVVPRILQGKGVQVMGSMNVSHSFSYMPDVARTLCAVATSDNSWGRPWMVPSITMTQRQFVDGLCEAAGVKRVKVSQLPAAFLRVLGIAVPLMRELQEVQYQFNQPFVVDATETTEILNVAATSAVHAFAETIAWWQNRR